MIKQLTNNSHRILSLLCGGLLAGSFASLISPAKAQQVQGCPGLYYEEPYNSRVLVPDGCRPNVFTEQMRGSTPGATQTFPRPGTTITPPAPEEQSNVVARVEPGDSGEIAIKLKNETNVRISYEVVANTGDRVVEPGEEVMLLGIPVPATVTAWREDNGMLRMIPMSPEDGMLVIRLDEDPTFDDTQGVVRIQKDGDVYVL